MSELASYERTGAIAKITMDDGKVNVMSGAMLSALLSALDHAEKDAAIVLLTSGREGIFSAGFDTKVLASRDPQQIYDMVRLGAELAARILSFRYPVVIACNGHAFPMGAFLMLASDIRIGADGPFKIGMNEVAIGIPVPSFALELGRERLVPAYLHRTALTGEMFAPHEAMAAGFLDRVVPLGSLQTAADAAAAALTKIDLAAHASTKQRLRKPAIERVRAAIDSEITLDAYRRRSTESPSG
ncbi:MAG TPA: crotonase/enoyl-CoA hydratase family protein [Steroidobacteraceae bacterium]|nr:crotonase/enoyl-CoA hydratase family protein [Steroidobacteraceae bacterium]